MVFVQGLAGSNLTSSVELHNGNAATVAELFAEISRSHTTSTPLSLSYCGKILNATDSSPLKRFGIDNNSTIFAHPPLRGGAQCGKMVKGRSKEKGEDATARMRWLQEQAAKRIAARDALKAQRDKALAEAEMTRRHNVKIMTSMRALMREEKLQQLKKELESLASLHEDTVKRKDAMIETLLKTIEFAYDQHSVAAMSHMDHVERLIRIQDQRLLLSERQFEADLKMLVDEFDDERDEIVMAHAREVAELNAVHMEIEREEHEENESARADLQTLRQECGEKREDTIDELRSVLDGRLEVIQDSFEDAHLEYLERTDKRVSDFKHYTKINRDREKAIERSVRQIERLQLKMQEIRNNMRLNWKKFGMQHKSLEKEKAAIQTQVKLLREKMRRFQANQRERRVSLSRDSAAALESLREKFHLAERILTLGELLRHKETEREKIEPFETLDEETRTMEDEINQSKDADTIAVRGEIHPLSNFHRKFNKALSEKLLVERERKRLLNENEQLMKLLEKTQNGLVVNDIVLTSPNPLFVVNGRHGVHTSIEQEHELVKRP